MPRPEAGSAATSSCRTTSTCRCGWPGSPPTGATSARSRSPATAPSSLTLPVGSYRLQFTDKRPSYDVTKFAPTDATVTVRSGSTAVRNVRMHRGAAITGTVRTAGGSGSHATVTAANKAEQSFSTIANDKGQFAIGGLPAGSYSVFTYDRKKTYVAKSTYVKKLAAGHPQNIDINLNKRAGNLLVDLYAGDQPINGTLMVTAISKKTGQFWTMKARNGTADLKGVYPGRYTLIVPGYRDFFGKTGAVSRGKVSSGRTAFGSFRLTEHGGAFTGRLVSQGAVSKAIASATVRLYDGTGTVVAEATTAVDGSFRVGGRLGNIASLTLVAFDAQEGVRRPDGLGPEEPGQPDQEPRRPRAGARARPVRIALGVAVGIADASASTTASLQPRSASPTATPTVANPGVTGTVVDASNSGDPPGGRHVQLFNADGVKLGRDDRSADGQASDSAHALATSRTCPSWCSPGRTPTTWAATAQRCQYRWTQHGGVSYTAGEDAQPRRRRDRPQGRRHLPRPSRGPGQSLTYGARRPPCRRRPRRHASW